MFGRSGMTDIPGARYLMDSWIVAGLVAVTSVTTTMGAFGIMVEDKSKKIIKDIRSSPLPRVSIAGGYILSAFVIGTIMCIIALILCELYIASRVAERCSTGCSCVKVFGLILLSTFSNTALVLFYVSFFQSNNAFPIASTIIGTVIGFMMGIYIPIRAAAKRRAVGHQALPAVAQRAAAAAGDYGECAQASFANAPAGLLENFNSMLGVSYKIGETAVTPIMSIALLVASGDAVPCAGGAKPLQKEEIRESWVGCCPRWRLSAGVLLCYSILTLHTLLHFIFVV